MCLEITNTDPNKLNKKFKKGKITFYKCIRVHSVTNRIYTQFQNTKVKPGFLKAKPKLNIASVESSAYIEHGAIHVYTNKKYALDQANFMRGEVIIPVVCYKKDFIAQGYNNDACFSKIFISEKDYNKALRATSKYSVVGK